MFESKWNPIYILSGHKNNKGDKSTVITESEKNREIWIFIIQKTNNFLLENPT